jgi:hypothetical protein
MSLGLALAALLTGSGCWEEIHYVPKPGGVQTADATTERPTESPPGTGDVAEATPPEPTAVEPATAAPPAAANPLVEEAETPQPPEADALFSPEGSKEITAEVPEQSDVPTAGAAPGEDLILPTPEGLAADLEQAGESEGEGAGGELRPAQSSQTPSPAATAEERRFVWEAASKWSLAAAISAKGMNADRYQSILDEAVVAAAKVDVALPPLPSTTDAGELEATVIEGLRGESAVALTNAIANRFGADEAAVADLAIRSHLLLLTYSPRSGDALLQAEALRRAAEASGLPAETWTPLVKLLDERAPFVDVRQAVFAQDKRIESALAPSSGGTP